MSGDCQRNDGRGRAELVEALQGLTRTLVGVALRSLASVPGLTLPQVRLLLALREAGPSPGLELAKAIEMSPASVSRHAERLVQSGYLKRVVSPENRRVVPFELTESGQAVVDDVEADRARAFGPLIAKLDDTEVTRVAADLLRMTGPGPQRRDSRAPLASG